MPSSNSPRPEQTVTYPSPVTDTVTVTDPLPVPIRPLRILACPGRGCCSSLPCPALPCAPTQLTPQSACNNNLPQGGAASRLRRQTGCPSLHPGFPTPTAPRLVVVLVLCCCTEQQGNSSSQNHVDADHCYCYSATPFSLSQPPSPLPILLRQLVDIVPLCGEPTPAPDEPRRSLIFHLHLELRPFHGHADVLVHREWVVFLQRLFSSPIPPTRPGTACHPRAQQLHHHARLQGTARQRLVARLAKEETTEPRRLEQVLRRPAPQGDHRH